MYQLLVVDDEVWMRKGLQNLIGHAGLGFAVKATASDGQEALALLEKVSIDAVLTDIRMAGMDGLELIKNMRERQWNQPVAVITGYNEFEYARTAFRLGAVDYLLKPINKQELSEVLRHIHGLLELRKAAGQTPVRQQLQQSTQGIELIATLVQVINCDYDKDLSISLLADQAGFNASYVSRLFKLETGKGFVQYLTEIRIQKAKDLLRSTRMNVSEIAKKVGFWDERHFSRLFKRELGKTPIEFRNNEQLLD